jgi:hypothetical protein
MSTPNILLPGDDTGWSTADTTVKVIASQWGNDSPEDGPVWFVAMLLRPNPPYYEVAEFTLYLGTWELTTSHGTRMNINDAVRLYAEMGGDN